ncbi:hypothetical protein TraAM80_07594 [Trypanosoma rangeli]|uniref:Trans-sialidase n=1 Tax=Trypanosoma rangeli TaxID=5698 RepID=A0A3R7RDJ4_TRYRA|nr:uncharacterized protein TraAM80_07594 [Trypanosoma rangeli]RNF00431.1 hypothetical protein TraAM80_07594 [Trypanosoma rangeli]|eukprot:RNF00431.1 hypothetical protein TraAM80_07594 [Trypanosoma rangeli]
MGLTLRSTAALFFVLCTFPIVHGRLDKIQLPLSVASQMSGEWGVQAHSPCNPSIVSGTLTWEGEKMTMHWQHDTFLGPQLESATDEGDIVMHAGGLHAFNTRTQELATLLYAICGVGQTNTLITPHRPGLENNMDTTVLTEYTGVLLKNSVDALNTCQMTAPNVFIRLLGSGLHGLQSNHGKVKESLQFLEMQFDVANMTRHCMEVRDRTEGERGSVKTTRRGKKNRKHRLGSAKGTHGEHRSITDQSAEEGSIVLRFVRRTPKSK